MGAAPGAGPGDDVRHPIAGHVPGRDEHAARERGVIGEEAAHLRPGDPVEDSDMGAAPGAGPGDDVRHPIAGDVARRHDRPPGETRPSHRVTLVGEEAPHLGPAHPVEDPDVRPAAGARARDDVRAPVPGDVRRRHEHPAGETRGGGRVTLVGEEAPHLGAGHPVEDPDVRAPAGARPDHDVRLPVSRHVAQRHVHPAPERRVEGEEAVHREPRQAPQHQHQRGPARPRGRDHRRRVRGGEAEAECEEPHEAGRTEVTGAEPPRRGGRGADRDRIGGPAHIRVAPILDSPRGSSSARARREDHRVGVRTTPRACARRGEGRATRRRTTAASDRLGPVRRPTIRPLASKPSTGSGRDRPRARLGGPL